MNKLFSKTTNYIDKLIENELYVGKGTEGPIAKQFIIDEREYSIRNEEVNDPIGDERYTKCKGIIHRYPDRLLLIPRNDCLVQCRFCFRKWKLPSGESELNEQEIIDAMKYIDNQKDVWEVILTGGEPLLTSYNKLRLIINELKNIDHVKVLRIHTRSVIVKPDIINDEMLEILKMFKPLYIVIHCNHPDEITKNVSETLSKIVDSGIICLSQSALLKGINDNSKVLEALFKKLIENRVKPYYLHHCDLVPGTYHFRTSIEDGQDALKGIRGRVSGICWPTYVLDIPEGYGKVPLGPIYYAKDDEGKVWIKDYKNNIHLYPDVISN